MRKADLIREYEELVAKVRKWKIDSSSPDYNGDITEEDVYSWEERMNEIEAELDPVHSGYIDAPEDPNQKFKGFSF